MAIKVTFVHNNMKKGGQPLPRVVPKDIVEPPMLYEYMAMGSAQKEKDVELAMNKLAGALIEFLKELQQSATVTTVAQKPALLPHIDYISDYQRRPAESPYLPRDSIHIRGSRLTFDQTDTETGIFFMSATGDATRATLYTHTGNLNLDCFLPYLAPGSYNVEMRTRPTGTTVRTGRYDGVIAVGK